MILPHRQPALLEQPAVKRRLEWSPNGAKEGQGPSTVSFNREHSAVAKTGYVTPGTEAPPVLKYVEHGEGEDNITAEVKRGGARKLMLTEGVTIPPSGGGCGPGKADEKTKNPWLIIGGTI